MLFGLVVLISALSAQAATQEFLLDYFNIFDHHANCSVLPLRFSATENANCQGSACAFNATTGHSYSTECVDGSGLPLPPSYAYVLVNQYSDGLCNSPVGPQTWGYGVVSPHCSLLGTGANGLPGTIQTLFMTSSKIIQICSNNGTDASCDPTAPGTTCVNVTAASGCGHLSFGPGSLYVSAIQTT